MILEYPLSLIQFHSYSFSLFHPSTFKPGASIRYSLDILNNCKIKLVQLPKKVFRDAAVETCIFVLLKENNLNKKDKNTVIVERLTDRGEISLIKQFTQSDIYKNHLYNFQLYAGKEGDSVLHKIKNSGKRLGDFFEFFYGLKTGDDDKFIFEEKKNKECMNLIRSKDIGKYLIDFDKKYAVLHNSM